MLDQQIVCLTKNSEKSRCCTVRSHIWYIGVSWPTTVYFGGQSLSPVFVWAFVCVCVCEYDDTTTVLFFVAVCLCVTFVLVQTVGGYWVGRETVLSFTSLKHMLPIGYRLHYVVIQSYRATSRCGFSQVICQGWFCR